MDLYVLGLSLVVTTVTLTALFKAAPEERHFPVLNSLVATLLLVQLITMKPLLTMRSSQHCSVDYVGTQCYSA